MLPLCGLSLEACDTFSHVSEESSLASPVEVQTRGILFDLDGVLVDSTPAVARCWSRWAVQYGFNAEEVVRQAHGRPSIVTLRELMPNGDYEEENRKMEEWEIADTDGVVPLPGVLEILRALPANQWAIVTSCTPALAEVRIRVAGLPTTKKDSDIRRCAAVQAGARSLFEGCGVARIGADRLRRRGRCAGRDSRGKGGGFTGAGSADNRSGRIIESCRRHLDRERPFQSVPWGYRGRPTVAVVTTHVSI